MKPFLMLAAACLAGCASYGPGSLVAGQTADQVIGSMGTPTARYALPEGASRLEFARGPYGKHTYMVDIDALGHVARWRQVLSEQNFDAVKPGWSAQDLLLSLGTPSQRRSGGRQGGEVWSYRYEAVFCQWFQVSVIDAQVHDAGYGPDPSCEADAGPFAHGHSR